MRRFLSQAFDRGPGPSGQMTRDTAIIQVPNNRPTLASPSIDPNADRLSRRVITAVNPITFHQSGAAWFDHRAPVAGFSVFCVMPRQTRTAPAAPVPSLATGLSKVKCYRHDPGGYGTTFQSLAKMSVCDANQGTRNPCTVMMYT